MLFSYILVFSLLSRLFGFPGCVRLWIVDSLFFRGSQDRWASIWRLLALSADSFWVAVLPFPFLDLAVISRFRVCSVIEFERVCAIESAYLALACF